MGAQRIGVLGGGVGGLSLAHFLGKAGYDDVTVLEAESRPGGQCCDSVVDGRSYDVGAIFADGSYHRVFGLLEDLGLELGRRTGGFLRLADNQMSPPLGGPDVLAPIEERLQMLDFESGYRSLLAPGFRGLHPDLYLPFDSFVAKHSLQDLRELLLPFWTGFGYGFFSDSPTAYVLKYMNLEARRACFGTGEVNFLEGGFAGLCTALAEKVDVTYGFVVDAIERRSSGGFVVRSRTSEESFDRLVVCFDPSRIPALMRCDEEFVSLISSVRSHEYSVALMTVEDFSDRSLVMVDNLTAERQGHVQIAVRRYPDRSVFVFYSLSRGVSDQELQKRFRSDVHELGGSVLDVHFTRRWSYFQHVNADSMAAGFYDRLEEMQGRGGLYFAGQLMNHSSVEKVVEYSADLVRRFF